MELLQCLTVLMKLNFYSISDFHVGVVSGYFNPLHGGHLEYINSAKDNCDFLIAIVNSDLQVFLKGSKRFMDEEHRREIVSNLKSVDLAAISLDLDKTQCCTLKKIREMFPFSKISFFIVEIENLETLSLPNLTHAKNIKFLK